MNVSSKTPEAAIDKQEQPMKHHCEHHTDCMKMIQALLDGEANEAEKEHFRQNMDKCMPCIQTYHLEKCIKDALHSKVERRPCPEKLVAVIKAQLNN
jgi:anti-sigma factor (TIGR02949 family)